MVPFFLIMKRFKHRRSTIPPISLYNVNGSYFRNNRNNKIRGARIGTCIWQLHCQLTTTYFEYRRKLIFAHFNRYNMFNCLFSNPWDMLVLYRSSTCDHIVNHICLVCCLIKCSMLLDRCTCHKNWNVINLIIRKYKYRKGLNWKSPTSTKITRVDKRRNSSLLVYLVVSLDI